MSNPMIKFSGKNIQVTVAAKIMGKDPAFVRKGLIDHVLPIGTAYKKDDSRHYDFYISPKLFQEYTGFYFDDDIIPAASE